MYISSMGKEAFFFRGGFFGFFKGEGRLDQLSLMKYLEGGVCRYGKSLEYYRPIKGVGWGVR